MEVFYTPVFTRQFNKLEEDLQDEAAIKIKTFKNSRNHQQLKVHKLKGILAGRYSFSVNYRYRIVFSYLSKNKAVLLAIGDHDVYK